MSAVATQPKVEDLQLLAFSYWPANLEMRLVQRFINDKAVFYRLSVTSAINNDGMFRPQEQDFNDYHVARAAFGDRVKEIMG